uniref:CD274 molecule n=1 Tax=Prolemur simus TaxID=1328070 RepID=A0A8C9AUV8_PROSS
MRIFDIFTFTAYWHLLNAFTVTVPKDLYVVEYGSNVTIECRFPVEKQLDLMSLVVYWEMDNKNIIQFVRGEEDLKVQDSSYRDRAWLLKDQLFLGSAALEITDVKLRDAGVYRCMISYGGADYKRITLKVNGEWFPGLESTEASVQQRTCISCSNRNSLRVAQAKAGRMVLRRQTYFRENKSTCLEMFF